MADEEELEPWISAAGCRASCFPCRARALAPPPPAYTNQTTQSVAGRMEGFHEWMQSDLGGEEGLRLRRRERRELVRRRERHLHHASQRRNLRPRAEIMKNDGANVNL